jgi:alkylresorcinol/alkylpyrone synthase
VNFKLVDEDSYMHIGRELPEIAGNDLLPLVQTYLAANGMVLEEVDHFLVHPGGRGIIDGVKEGLALPEEAVGVSREVLAGHGNMGTPSSFYVLKLTEQRRSPQPGETGLMVTIGPGVTIGLMLLDW